MSPIKQSPDQGSIQEGQTGLSRLRIPRRYQMIGTLRGQAAWQYDDVGHWENETCIENKSTVPNIRDGNAKASVRGVTYYSNSAPLPSLLQYLLDKECLIITATLDAPEEVPKACAFYRECAVVNLRIPSPATADTADAQMGDLILGVHLGQAVWEGHEGVLKERENVDPQGDRKAGRDEDCGFIPQAVGCGIAPSLWNILVNAHTTTNSDAEDNVDAPGSY
ncbi:hypothetical protein BDR07DRAFT_1457019 [Suillus spraguei]|nr:hypothetical protein BDR07DRAFT_1457019 [Suillus spraguei]